jgi:hypothetical protein
MVPVDGHAVAVRSDAAAHRGIISVHKAALLRNPILSNCAQQSNARLPVVELVEQKLGKWCIGSGTVREEYGVLCLPSRHQAAEHRLVHLVRRPIPVSRSSLNNHHFHHINGEWPKFLSQGISHAKHQVDSRRKMDKNH